MKIKLITSPDPNTFFLIISKMRPEFKSKLKNETFGAAAIIQDCIPNILYYADVAAKASNVKVAELMGNCPQSMTTIVILGEIESVKTALKAIEERQ